mmetsp:Transcript_115725/g.210485  ORF Transcript_115725/g.210485 Transcript_115725/m.210485 type:complete len:102 (-) Transcript_115725:111-416(-)
METKIIPAVWIGSDLLPTWRRPDLVPNGDAHAEKILPLMVDSCRDILSTAAEVALVKGPDREGAIFVKLVCLVDEWPELSTSTAKESEQDGTREVSVRMFW